METKQNYQNPNWNDVWNRVSTDTAADTQTAPYTYKTPDVGTYTGPVPALNNPLPVADAYSAPQQPIPQPEPNTPELPDYTADVTALAEFMDRAASDAQMYRCLAPKCGAEMRRKCTAMAERALCNLKKMQARYYIITGVTYSPNAVCPQIISPIDALRQQYFYEVSGADEYQAAAESMQNPDIASLCMMLAVDATGNAATIGCIIQSMCF